MSFFTALLEVLCYACLPPFAFGLAVWGCRRAFCFFVGDDSGLPLIRAVSVLSTPVREAGHAMAAVLFLHRLEDVRLLDLHDPDGEYGYVEHSYNPRNPIAILGNFFYALGPAITGLFLVLVILLVCFNGVLGPFFDTLTAYGEQGAGFADYVGATASLLTGMFGREGSPVWLRILGCALLLALCLGIHITPTEILDALSGIGIFALIAAAVLGLVALFHDGRVGNLLLSALRSYATAVTALFLVVLAFALAAVLLGVLFGVIRTLFNIDKGYTDNGEDDEA